MALPQPDPSRYRGGSTNSVYKQDLLNWQQTQQPTVEPVGQEEVVSLNSSFDEEPDAFTPVYIAPPADYVPDYVEPEVTPEVEPVATATGYRETGDTTTTSDPFSDYARASKEGSEFSASYSEDPEGYADALASGSLPYMDYTDEMMQDVSFMKPTDQQLASGTFGGRLISGDTEEYERAFTYNEMLNRGLDEQTARAWYESGDDANEAYNLIADNFLAKQENYVTALDSLKEEGNVVEFQQQYKNSDFSGKVSYLHNLYKNEEISKEDYEAAWRNEYNLDQAKKGTNEFLFEIQAPRGSDKIDSIYRDPNAVDYKTGDSILVVGNPDDPESWGVAFKDFYYPKEANATQQLQYFDRMAVTNEPIPDSSEWVQFRDEFLIPGARTILAAATGGTSEKLYSAVKLASGETLHGSDYANLVIGGLEQAGVIKPPVGLDGDMVNPLGGGTVGSTMADTLLTGSEVTDGVGLFGLDYGTTVNVIEAIGNQDPVKLVTSLVPTDTVTGLLEDIGIPPDIANDPDVIEGIKTGVTTVLNGGDLEEGLKDGLVEYITEGGSFGNVPDVDLGVIEDALKPLVDPLLSVVETVGETIEDVVKPVVDPVITAVETVGETIEDVVKPVVDPVITAVETVGETIEDVVKPVVDPVITAVEDVAPLVEDVIRDVGSALDDTVSDTIGDVSSAIGDVTDPVLSTIGDVGSAIDDTVSDTIGDVSSAIGDVTDPVTSSIGDAGSAIEDAARPIGSTIDDNILQPIKDSLLTGGGGGRLSSTRTTDSLFGRDLFKFKEKDFGLVERIEQAPPKEQVVNFEDDPFSSDFNNRNLFG